MAEKDKTPKEPPKPSDDKSNTPFDDPKMQKFHGSNDPPAKKRRDRS